MRIAFYAPMKPPTHPTPSGDRRMAELLMAALAAAGHQVELASRFRSHDGGGDPARQARLEAVGKRLAARLVRRYRARPAAERPRAWFTYHLYHKAPDWLGPAVADALGLPYLLAEASHSPKRAQGPWASGHAAAAAAIARADAVLALNPADAEGLRPLLAPGTPLVPLKPFLDLEGAPRPACARHELRARLAGRLGLDPGGVWLLAVAMMRPGDKLASYEVLGAALARQADRRWQLVVAGDGPARPRVQAALERAAAGGGRIAYAGVLDADGLAELYAAADLCVWPAINEAYGMALLEAQAAGLPVVAGASSGVAQIVRQGETGLLAPAGEVDAFASAVDSLLDRPDKRAAMGRRAAAIARSEHDQASAARILDQALREAAARAAKGAGA